MLNAKIDLDGYIEHLQETGKVSLVGNDVNITDLIDELYDAGYDTEYDSCKDCLILLEIL